MATMVNQNRTKLFLLIPLFLLSCSRQDQFEIYTVKVKNQTLSVGEKLEYRFKIEDSLQLYDIEVFMRLSPFFDGNEVPISITIFSPDGHRYMDPLTFKTDLLVKSQKSGLWKDFRWKYRENICFPKKGSWLIRLENAADKKITGLGEISFILKESDGKR